MVSTDGLDWDVVLDTLGVEDFNVGAPLGDTGNPGEFLDLNSLLDVVVDPVSADPAKGLNDRGHLAPNNGPDSLNVDNTLKVPLSPSTRGGIGVGLDLDEDDDFVSSTTTTSSEGGKSKKGRTKTKSKKGKVAAAGKIKAVSKCTVRPRPKPNIGKRGTGMTTWFELCGMAHQLHDIRNRLGVSLEATESMHSKLKKDPNGGNEALFKKLLSMYEECMVLTSAEQDLINAMALTANKPALQETGKASFLPKKSQSAVINSLDSSLPVWPGDISIALCGATPAPDDWPVPPGHQVAAHVNTQDSERRWILGSIIDCQEDKNKYVVEDIMEESSLEATSVSERYVLPRNRVIPLAEWAPNTKLHAAFYSRNAEVLALYPQTTCFYPALVHEPPHKDRPSSYMMKFYDDDMADGTPRYQEVPIKFVVRAPVEPKSKARKR
eukprot:m.136742 g.136742  ORF g.136742 m.136742 type:complete len:437 (+) comp14735_c0_seq12:123-1433(+)